MGLLIVEGIEDRILDGVGYGVQRTHGGVSMRLGWIEVRYFEWLKD
jgi:hypothetical protein